MSTVILVSSFPRLNRSSYFMMLLLKHIGHRCIWRRWGSHSLRTLRERLSCQSVSTYLTLYIVLLFLNSSHSMARGRKAEALRVLYADNTSVEVVEISDIATGRFEDAFVGVNAVIHVASPLPGHADTQGMLNVRLVILVISFEAKNILLVGCYRGLFECSTTSRESRSQEIYCYKFNHCCDWRSRLKILR